MKSPLPVSARVVVGVDTHKHLHVAAAIDEVVGVLATVTVANDTAGSAQLVAWAESFGKVVAFGIEGTGSYGSAVASYVRRHGHKVVEVSRPDRRLRRLQASPTHWMQKMLPGQSYPVWRPLFRKLPMARSK